VEAVTGPPSAENFSKPLAVSAVVTEVSAPKAAPSVTDASSGTVSSPSFSASFLSHSAETLNMMVLTKSEESVFINPPQEDPEEPFVLVNHDDLDDWCKI
jgi:uncharacterized protein (DUF362 family)